VLVLMDEPAFAGCKLGCRVIGIIEGEQGNSNKKERNDRIVAIENDNHSFSEVKHIDDLGEQFQRELEEFFVNYHRLSGKKFQILNVKGPAAARKAIDKARQKAK
jgi:inorganic pyrophosphatase